MPDSPRIYLSPPHMTGSEMDYIHQAFDSNWIAPLGPNVDRFEKDIASCIGNVTACALSSGTAAMHLALRILGVKEGDEVICQSFTFCGSVNPVTYLKAVPVLVDSEEETWNLDPELLEQAVGERVKKGKRPAAIIYVHLYGMPAKVAEIRAIAEKYEIPLIEDAAEALGARYHDEPVGRFGDISIFSFNGNKIITTSGGGALVSSDENHVQRARFLATQARDPAPHYEHSETGYNYRLSNVLAGIGIGQLQHLGRFVNARRRNYDYYLSALSDIPAISFLKEPEMAFPNRWLTCITIDPGLTNGIDRESLRMALEYENIESRPFWKPMHMQPLYKDVSFYGNGVSEQLFKHGLCLPSGSSMKEGDLERVISIIRKTLTR